VIVPLADFRQRLQHVLELDGTALTEAQLARLAERYASCGGTDLWDVREYARATRLGAREYRVVRGTGITDVFASEHRANASAVQAALNALESGTS
jgi:hypothetical protein